MRLSKYQKPDKYECPFCRRVVAASMPKGGDGSVDVYHRHKDREGQPCVGSRQIVGEVEGAK